MVKIKRKRKCRVVFKETESYFGRIRGLKKENPLEVE